ncbi:Pathogenicity locus [Azonexus hydrophilus]|uniref:Pathogenicity locus n=1 Tax=Azonexus hydrophilus TaxID=418702 RepID=A0ABZ2XIJ4_9RHOO|nr:Pathogenicity locus [Azonexus hydrophilus]
MNGTFPADQRAALLALPGVGPTVIRRLEEAGYAPLARLAGEESAVVTLHIARMIGSTCWHNNPQARAAIDAAIALARQWPN